MKEIEGQMIECLLDVPITLALCCACGNPSTNAVSIIMRGVGRNKKWNRQEL